MPRHKLTDEEMKRGNQFQSGAHAVESGRKGGIQNGINHARRRTMKELAEKISEAPIASAKTKKQLEKMGLTDDELINQAVIVAAVYMQAANGNMQAVSTWMELTDNIKSNSDKAEVIIDV